MEITQHAPKVDVAHMPVERLAGNHAVSEKDKVAELSRQFEAVLVRQILNDAQKPLIKSKYNPESATSSIHRDLVVNEMADKISHSGGLGLAKQLQHELTRQAKLDPAQAPALKSATFHPVTPATLTTPATPALPRLPRWKH